MKKQFIILILFTLVVTSTIAQTRENLLQAREVADNFLTAMFHGNYERAKSFAYDFDATKYIRDVNTQIDQCVEQNNCLPIIPDFKLEILRYRVIERQYLESIVLYEFEFYYKLKEHYEIISVLGSDDEPFLVNYVCPYRYCASPENRTDKLEDREGLLIPDF